MSNKSQTVCLCGFMGAGKSAVGYRLAAKMRKRFIDLDTYIEQQEGDIIRNIFQNKGEEYFRSCERKYLSKLLAEVDGGSVISLGGGSLQDEHHTEKLKESCMLVYVKVPVATLLARLQKDKKRPMLRNSDGSVKSEKDLKLHIQNMIKQREPLYLKADIVYNSDGFESIADSAGKLHTLISEYDK